MKTTALLFGFLLNLVTFSGYSQDRTTVTANSNDISDNLDLRAVAHVFGESDNLEDFERRLNDPSLKISNLDLNNDNQVDYMRVIESVENYTHLIIIQSVIGRDSFQDIATIEVEKDRRNRNVQVQIVGNVFLYGSNYIYEPVYYTSPIIYRQFWVPNYVAYYSPWAWSFYPTYYYAWNPWPVYTYHNHVNYYVNVNNSCYYTNHRRSNRAVAMHHSRRGNAYEKQHPNRSFSDRNKNVSNRHELAQTRGNSSSEGRTTSATESREVNKSIASTRGSQSTNTTARNTGRTTGTRDQNTVAVKNSSNDRSVTTTRGNNGTKARSSETRTTSRSNQSVDRSSSQPSRSTASTKAKTSENRTTSKSSPTVSRGSQSSRSSNPVVSNNSQSSRSSSSDASRSNNSSQRSSGGNSGNSSSNRGGRG